MQVAAYEAYVLRLHVDNAAWATRLRYMDAALKQALAQRHPDKAFVYPVHLNPNVRDVVHAELKGIDNIQR